MVIVLMLCMLSWNKKRRRQATADPFTLKEKDCTSSSSGVQLLDQSAEAQHHSDNTADVIRDDADGGACLLLLSECAPSMSLDAHSCASLPGGLLYRSPRR